MDFQEFGKIPRLSRKCIITEKIDGTNAQILITEDNEVFVGSRKRWITPENDHFGFAKWVYDNIDEILTLGPGQHFGEWWGQGIQRRYGLDEKRFSLFNTSRWREERPSCCHVVPVLYFGSFETEKIDNVLSVLKRTGSIAEPGFMDPEGIMVFHLAANMIFKKTIIGDEKPKD